MVNQIEKNIENIENIEDNTIISILVDLIKDELLKSNISVDVIMPILLHLLYYIVPFIIIILLLNFISTIFAVFIVNYFFRSKIFCTS